MNPLSMSCRSTSYPTIDTIADMLTQTKLSSATIAKVLAKCYLTLRIYDTPIFDIHHIYLEDEATIPNVCMLINTTLTVALGEIRLSIPEIMTVPYLCNYLEYTNDQGLLQRQVDLILVGDGITGSGILDAEGEYIAETFQRAPYWHVWNIAERLVAKYYTFPWQTKQISVAQAILNILSEDTSVYLTDETMARDRYRDLQYLATSIANMLPPT